MSGPMWTYLGSEKPERPEQLNVEGQAGQPLIATDYVGGAHEVIVHGVGEVVGGDAVGLQKHLIDVVFRDGERALDQIVCI